MNQTFTVVQQTPQASDPKTGEPRQEFRTMLYNIWRKTKRSANYYQDFHPKKGWCDFTKFFFNFFQFLMKNFSIFTCQIPPEGSQTKEN